VICLITLGVNCDCDGALDCSASVAAESYCVYDGLIKLKSKHFLRMISEESFSSGLFRSTLLRCISGICLCFELRVVPCETCLLIDYFF